VVKRLQQQIQDGGYLLIHFAPSGNTYREVENRSNTETEYRTLTLAAESVADVACVARTRETARLIRTFSV